MSGLLVNNYSQRNPPALGDALSGLLGNWGDNIEQGLLTSFPFLAENDPYKIGQELLREGAGLGTIAGVKAKTLNPKTLELAEQMRGAGASRDDIWKATGEQFGQPSYFDPVDNSFRWEIDDLQMKYLPQKLSETEWRGSNYLTGRVDQAVGDTDKWIAPNIPGYDPTSVSRLTEAYPNLGGVSLTDYPKTSPSGMYGAYSDSVVGPRITLWDQKHPRDLVTPPSKGTQLARRRSTLLHELNHAIQDTEGFPGGGNPKMFNQQSEAELMRDALSWNKEMDGYIKRHPGSEKLDRSGVENLLHEEFDAIEARDWVPSREARELAGQPYLYNPDLNPTARKNAADLVRLYGLDRKTSAYSGRDIYDRLLGEVDSRAVQARRDLPLSRRIAKPFWKDYDVPEEQIIRLHPTKGLL